MSIVSHHRSKSCGLKRHIQSKKQTHTTLQLSFTLVYSIMPGNLLVFCIFFLYLQACTSGPRGCATGFKHGGHCYSNATEIIPSEALDSPFPYNFPDAREPENPFPMPDCDGFILEEATVDLLQNAMKKGELTCTKIALCYLQRIQQTNGYAK